MLAGISAAIAAIPEEPPILLAVILGLGAYRLMRRGVLVRRLERPGGARRRRPDHHRQDRHPDARTGSWSRRGRSGRTGPIEPAEAAGLSWKPCAPRRTHGRRTARASRAPSRGPRGGRRGARRRPGPRQADCWFASRRRRAAVLRCTAHDGRRRMARSWPSARPRRSRWFADGATSATGIRGTATVEQAAAGATAPAPGRDGPTAGRGA